jgi:putative addiction module component (TIGR02574 family)
MSKQDILNELPKLRPDERRQILEHLCDLQDKELAEGTAMSAEEAALLDRELDDYRRNPDSGSSWEDVERRLLRRGQ